jgi:hypothetical protein
MNVHALAGLHMWLNARLFYLLHSEFVVEDPLHLALNSVPRFPNPVPVGTHVPHWAILDVTVCFKLFFSPLNSTIITRSRKTIGTPVDRMLLVVSMVS